jgi:hypothetical protein
VSRNPTRSLLIDGQRSEFICDAGAPQEGLMVGGDETRLSTPVLVAWTALRAM